jgi:hypothetical protein
MASVPVQALVWAVVDEAKVPVTGLRTEPVRAALAGTLEPASVPGNASDPA